MLHWKQSKQKTFCLENIRRWIGGGFAPPPPLATPMIHRLVLASTEDLSVPAIFLLSASDGPCSRLDYLGVY